MIDNPHLENLTLPELELCWVGAKDKEDQAKSYRLDIESMITAQNSELIADRGTSTLTHIKVTNGVTEEWLTEELIKLSMEIPADLFPFEIQYKKNAKGARYIQEHHPELWAKLRSALIEKPRKTSFSRLTKKEESK